MYDNFDYGNGMTPEEVAYNNMSPDAQFMQNQQMMNQSAMYPTQGGHRAVTKKMLLDFMIANLGAQEVVQVDEFETLLTRHICMGSTVIQLLQTTTYTIPTVNGPVTAQIVWCPNCRKLIVNRNSLDIL